MILNRGPRDMAEFMRGQLLASVNEELFSVLEAFPDQEERRQIFIGGNGASAPQEAESVRGKESRHPFYGESVGGAGGFRSLIENLFRNFHSGPDRKSGIRFKLFFPVEFRAQVFHPLLFGKQTLRIFSCGFPGREQKTARVQIRQQLKIFALFERFNFFSEGK